MNVYKNVTLSEYKKLPRGIRNNNPLNIRRGTIEWVGEVRSLAIWDDSANNYGKFYDRAFCQFSSMVYGVRAACKLLQNYQKRYNLKTIADIIGRWAPKSENNTDKYASVVASQMLCNADDVVNLQSRVQLTSMISAMIRVECGAEYTIYSNDYMLTAVRIAVDMIEREGGIKCA